MSHMTHLLFIEELRHELDSPAAFILISNYYTPALGRARTNFVPRESYAGEGKEHSLPSLSGSFRINTSHIY